MFRLKKAGVDNQTTVDQLSFRGDLSHRPLSNRIQSTIRSHNE
jgi:hypothetical protein